MPITLVNYHISPNTSESRSYILTYSYSEIELIKIKRLCKINNIELIDATTIQFIQLKILKFHFYMEIFLTVMIKMNIASFYLLNIKDTKCF